MELVEKENSISSFRTNVGLYHLREAGEKAFFCFQYNPNDFGKARRNQAGKLGCEILLCQKSGSCLVYLSEHALKPD